MPWGERRVLKWIRRNYGDMDVYITASGIDDQSLENDELRKYYLEKYIQEALKGEVRGQFPLKYMTLPGNMNQTMRGNRLINDSLLWA